MSPVASISTKSGGRPRSRGPDAAGAGSWGSGAAVNIRAAARHKQRPPGQDDGTGTWHLRRPEVPCRAQTCPNLCRFVAMNLLPAMQGHLWARRLGSVRRAGLLRRAGRAGGRAIGLQDSGRLPQPACRRQPRCHDAGDLLAPGPTKAAATTLGTPAPDGVARTCPNLGCVLPFIRSRRRTTVMDLDAWARCFGQVSCGAPAAMAALAMDSKIRAGRFGSESRQTRSPRSQSRVLR